MTRITRPDGVFAQYDHDPYGAVTLIQENGTSGLAAYGWTDLGQPASVQRFGGASTAHGYDAWGRMTSMSHDLPGSAGDVAFGYGWNAAGQIVSRTISDPSYVSAPVTGTTGYANDGLNRVMSVGGVPVGYDANRNLTDAAGTIYGFDAAGRMTYGAGSDHAYDPADRLYSAGSPSGPTTRFQYAGEQLVGEYDATGALLSRHVPGPGLDQMLLTYTGSGLTARIWLFGDERGSVIARADGSGVAINRYDEYGVPAPGNTGRFGYTGQMWLPEAGVYHYRARAYAPQLGRFLQTDPIGYAAGMNLYAYVSADPVNWTDPLGLDAWLVSRPATPLAPFGHYFVVIAPCLGCSGRIFSFGPDDISGFSVRLIADRQIAATDARTWRNIRRDQDRVNITRINASDARVAAYGEAYEEAIGAGYYCYSLTPELDGCVNSNSAAFGIATGASGGDQSGTGGGMFHPGAGSWNRIRIPVIIVSDPVAERGRRLRPPIIEIGDPYPVDE